MKKKMKDITNFILEAQTVTNINSWAEQYAKHNHLDIKYAVQMISALVLGYFNNSKQVNKLTGDDKKYLCTKENILSDLFDPQITDIDAAKLDKIIKDMNAAGYSVKYNTNNDGKADAKKNNWVIA